jgi:hypothetical protein
MKPNPLKKTQTPGPRPRRAHINLDRIRMTTYHRLYWRSMAETNVSMAEMWFPFATTGVTNVRTFPPRLEPLISALEIWAGSVIPLVGPIGASPPAIQFLRAWPMTWDFGSGTLHARSAGFRGLREGMPLAGGRMPLAGGIKGHIRTRLA